MLFLFSSHDGLFFAIGLQNGRLLFLSTSSFTFSRTSTPLHAFPVTSASWCSPSTQTRAVMTASVDRYIYKTALPPFADNSYWVLLLGSLIYALLAMAWIVSL
jgi:hypothetical protein